MPLLYRILRRLAVVVLIVGEGFVYLVMGTDSFSTIGLFVGVTLLGALPAAALYAIAWVVRPPLDRTSLRRLWRE